MLREHLPAPDTFMVGGESGEVDLAVMKNCHASIIGELVFSSDVEVDWSQRRKKGKLSRVKDHFY